MYFKHTHKLELYKKKKLIVVDCILNGVLVTGDNIQQHKTKLG